MRGRLDKYGHHPEARKLRFKLLDFSGLEPGFQAQEIDRLSRTLGPDGKPSFDASLDHFAEIASGCHFVPPELDSNSFDIIHLPFVLGSLYLGPMTAVKRVSSGERVARSDYDDFVGAQLLESSQARRATLRVMRHALSEAGRVLAPGGLIMINMGARPQSDATDMICMSDTPVSRSDFNDLMQGYKRIFSGNPQPSLPRTVAHIFALQVDE